MAATGKTAAAAPAIRNLRFMASIPVPLDPLSVEEELGPKFLPFLGLVERDRGIDHLERKLVELRVDHAARGHAVALLDEGLSLARQHEIREEQGRMGTRRAARDADRVGTAEGGFQRLPSD